MPWRPRASKSVGSLLVPTSDETEHCKTLCPDPSVNVEFFSLSKHVFKSLSDRSACLVLHGDHPSVFGQHINDRQEIAMPTIPSFERLHLHEIGLPLFVLVKHQDRERLEPSSNGAMQCLGQFPLQFSSGFLLRQSLSLSVPIHTTQ